MFIALSCDHVSVNISPTCATKNTHETETYTGACVRIKSITKISSVFKKKQQQRLSWHHRLTCIFLHARSEEQTVGVVTETASQGGVKEDVFLASETAAIVPEIIVKMWTGKQLEESVTKAPDQHANFVAAPSTNEKSTQVKIKYEDELLI